MSQTNNHPGLLAVIALGRLAPNDPRWINELAKRMEQPGTGDSFVAAWELGRRGEIAQSTVPALRNLAATTKNTRLRAMALTSAWRLDPSSPEPFSVLTEVLSQPGTAGRYELVRLLGELGASGRPVVPALRQLLYSRGIMMHDYAREALEAIAPESLSDPWK